MAQAAVQLEQQDCVCVICLDFLKDPVTLPCGHNYCSSCIQSYWDREEQSSCPQCRQEFSPRPALVTNSMLAELVEQVKSIELQLNPMGVYLTPFEMAEREHRGQILHTIHDKETALQKLQQEALSLRHCADAAVRHIKQSFNTVVRVMEAVHSEVTQQIKQLQEREEAQLKQLQDQLQRDITELRMTISEQDSLTPGQTLLHSPPPSALDPPRTYSLPLGSLEQAASAVTALTDLLQVTLRDGLQNISQSFRSDPHPPPRPQAALTLPEPKTRKEFINYAREIILDPNTAHQELSLSRGNRGVTKERFYSSDYERHPDRFSDFCQVMSTEGLTGRCYWEVEWDIDVIIAALYKNIRRKGDSQECGFGYNKQSWALGCSINNFSFWFHNIETKISVSGAGLSLFKNRIGVYLDHSAGVLAFYSIKDQSMSLLHRVQTIFTQPLYAGVRLERSFDTAYFPKLK